MTTKKQDDQAQDFAPRPGNDMTGANNPTVGGMTPKDPSLNATGVIGNPQSVSGAQPELSEAEKLAHAGSVGNPTVGGLTPKNEDLPAPATAAAKKTAKKEIAKAAVKVAEKIKAVSASVAKPAGKTAAAKKKAPAKKTGKR